MARVLVRAVVVVLLTLLLPVGPAFADDEGGDPTLEQPDPDGDENGGADRPGGGGGYDDDRDDDNGCGNDDDQEDDNRGHCRGVRDADPHEGHDEDHDGTDHDPEHDDTFSSSGASPPRPPAPASAPSAAAPRTRAPAPLATTPITPAPPHPVRSRLARQNAEVPSRASTTAAPLPEPLRLQGVGAEAGTVLAIPAPMADDDPGALAIAGGMIATLFGLALATLTGGSLVLRRPGRRPPRAFTSG